MMAAFTVWVTGPDMHDVEAAAHQIECRLRARAVRTELLDTSTPHIEGLHGEGVLPLLAATLARHDVVTIVALPIGTRAARDRARATMDRVVEVYVPRPEASVQGYEPPDRPDVEVACPDAGTGSAAARVVSTLEHLGFLESDAHAGPDAAEERAVRRRLKDLGYL